MGLNGPKTQPVSLFRISGEFDRGSGNCRILGQQSLGNSMGNGLRPPIQDQSKRGWIWMIEAVLGNPFYMY